MKNGRGVILYLAIVFAVSFGIALAFHGLGLMARLRPGLGTMIPFAALLWTPALAAFVASAVTGDVEPRLCLWPLPRAWAWGISIAVPALFAVTWGVTVWIGLDEADWSLATLEPFLRQGAGVEASLPPMPFFLVAGFLLSILLGSTICAFFLLGNEIGWRAYLLPQLLPMGRVKAYALSGVLWGLSFAPLIFLGYLGNEDTFSALMRSCCVATGLGIVLGELWRRFRHVGLVALAAGSFAGQVFGMWQFLFPFTSSPMAGAFGWISACVWLLAGLIALGFPGSQEGGAGDGSIAKE